MSWLIYNATQRNVAMVDWLIIVNNDNDSFNRAIEQIRSAKNNGPTLLMIMNDISLINNIIAETAGLHKVLLTDLDYDVLQINRLRDHIDVILPHRAENRTTSGYVKDAIELMENSVTEQPSRLLERCPTMNSLRYAIECKVVRTFSCSVPLLETSSKLGNTNFFLNRFKQPENEQGVM